MMGDESDDQIQRIADSLVFSKVVYVFCGKCFRSSRTKKTDNSPDERLACAAKFYKQGWRFEQSNRCPDCLKGKKIKRTKYRMV